MTQTPAQKRLAESIQGVRDEIIRKRVDLLQPAHSGRQGRVVPFSKPDVGDLSEADVVEMKVKLCGGSLQAFFYEKRWCGPSAPAPGPDVSDIFGRGSCDPPGGGEMFPEREVTMQTLQDCGCILHDPRGQGRFWIPPGRVISPHFLREESIRSICVSYGYREGEDVCYHRTSPAFENICGGVSLSNSAHISDTVSRMETESHGSCNTLKKNKTAFGVCYELFTIFGNITLRRDKNSGGMVSFKREQGARDVKKIFEIIESTLGSDFLRACINYSLDHHTAQAQVPQQQQLASNVAATAPPFSGKAAAPSHKLRKPRKAILVSDGGGERTIRLREAAPVVPVTVTVVEGVRCAALEYDGFFSVHMAVVTACLGRRLSVYPGNTLETTLQRVLGPQGVCTIGSLDDDSNAIKIRVLDWKVVREKAGLICPSLAAAAAELEGADQCVYDNTISITGKGSVIVRFSWENPIRWGDRACKSIKDTCELLCNVLRECC